jgi:hypothetical protein
VSYTDIDNNTGYAGSNGNIKNDPLFVGSSNYHLQDTSPCIDTGTSTSAPSTDIAGTLRPLGAGYDMGAYEMPWIDIDNDGVRDAVDNCPNVYNPEQLDANGNGTGDCCDPTPGCGGCAQPACDQQCSPPDSDGDGVTDAIDNCPNVYNPQQLDANGNGTGDCCDPKPDCGGCGQPACDTVCSK